MKIKHLPLLAFFALPSLLQAAQDVTQEDLINVTLRFPEGEVSLDVDSSLNAKELKAVIKAEFVDNINGFRPSLIKNGKLFYDHISLQDFCGDEKNPTIDVILRSVGWQFKKGFFAAAKKGKK